MNRTTRSVAAAALAAVVALGAVGPAVAAPQGGPGKPDKVAAKAEKQKPAKDRAAKQAQRLERMAERKAGYLDRLSTRHKVTRLGDMGARLAASMELDKGYLTDLADGTAEQTTTEALGAEMTPAQLVRSARPVVYQRIINQVRLIVANDLDELDATADDGTQDSTSDDDSTLTTEALADDGTHADAANLLDTVIAYHAWTPKSELKATQKQIADLLDELEEAEESELEETEEPETSEESTTS